MYAITLAAAELKIAAPESFNRLVEAFAQLETKYKDELMAADPSVIIGAQGKTWMASQLKIRLEQCLEQKRKYENRS